MSVMRPRKVKHSIARSVVMHTAGSGESGKTRVGPCQPFTRARKAADNAALREDEFFGARPAGPGLAALRGDEPFQRFDDQRVVVLLGQARNRDGTDGPGADGSGTQRERAPVGGKTVEVEARRLHRRWAPRARKRAPTRNELAP